MSRVAIWAGGVWRVPSGSGDGRADEAETWLAGGGGEGA